MLGHHRRPPYGSESELYQRDPSESVRVSNEPRPEPVGGIPRYQTTAVRDSRMLKVCGRTICATSATRVIRGARMPLTITESIA